MPPLAQIRLTEPVAPQIYDSIRARIVSGELPPGACLSETEIGAEYRVSRQPVREAFIRLADAGLLQVRPQRGTFVTDISAEAVLDARFVREAIEVAIVRRVATQGDASLVTELREQLAEQRRVRPDDSSEFLRLDEQFHRLLARAAGTIYAWSVIEEVKAQMDRVRYLSVHPPHIALLIDQHEAIVEAIAAGDAAAAEDAMRAHLSEIIKTLGELAAARPQLFASSPEQAAPILASPMTRR